MIAHTLALVRRWRMIERQAVQLTRNGMAPVTTPEAARMRRRALVIEALELRALKNRRSIF